MSDIVNQLNRDTLHFYDQIEQMIALVVIEKLQSASSTSVILLLALDKRIEFIFIMTELS